MIFVNSSFYLRTYAYRHIVEIFARLKRWFIGEKDLLLFQRGPKFGSYSPCEVVHNHLQLQFKENLTGGPYVSASASTCLTWTYPHTNTHNSI